MERCLDQLRNDNNTLRQCIQETGQLLDASKNEIKELHLQIKNDELKKEELKERSKQKIKEFVQEMLDDEDINIKGIPDCIEKKNL